MVFLRSFKIDKWRDCYNGMRLLSVPSAQCCYKSRYIVHLSIVYPTWGKYGGMVGGMQRKYGLRGGANVTCANEAFRVQR